MPNILRWAALGMVVAVSACAPAASEDAADDRPVVLSTFTVTADMVRVVGGDAVRVESLLPIGAEVHGYEPTPGDLRRAADADLVIDNGLGLEAWFEQFMRRLDVPRVAAAEGIDAIMIDGTDEPNPHAWMSPRDSTRYVDRIEEALVDLVPEARGDIVARADRYRADLAALEGRLREAAAEVPVERRLLVTCEGAFSYLARDAGLEEAYLWPVNSEHQVTPRRAADLDDLLERREVPAVFCESTVSSQTMRQLAGATDTPFGGTLYVDSLSGPDGPVPSHLDLLGHAVDLIVDALR